MKGARQLNMYMNYNFFFIIIRWDYFIMECQKKNISDVNEVKHCALDSGIYLYKSLLVTIIKRNVLEMWRRRLVIRGQCRRSGDSMAQTQRVNPFRFWIFNNSEVIKNVV